MRGHLFLVSVSVGLLAACAGKAPVPKAETEKKAYEILALVVGDDRLRAALEAKCAGEALPQTEAATSDETWKATYPAATPLATERLSSHVSEILDVLARVQPRLDQMMATDCHGELAGALKLTHDFLQSDEPKFVETLANGKPGVLNEGWHTNDAGEPIFQLSQAVGKAGVITIMVKPPVTPE